MAIAEPLAGLPSALVMWFKEYNGWSTLWSFAATVGVVIDLGSTAR